MRVPEKRASLVLIEDHEHHGPGIAEYLRNHPRFELLGLAATAEKGVALIKEKRPDIAIVDIYLPGGNGIDMTDAIFDFSASIGKRIAVVHISGMSTFKLRYGSMYKGASGYYWKVDKADYLVAVLHAAIEGRTLYDEQLLNALALRRRIERRTGPGALKAREYEVFYYFTAYVIHHNGRWDGAYADVAKRLDTRSRRIEEPMSVVRQDLQVKDNHDLVQIIRDAGYFEVPPPWPETRERSC